MSVDTWSLAATAMAALAIEMATPEFRKALTREEVTGRIDAMFAPVYDTSSQLDVVRNVGGFL